MAWRQQARRLSQLTLVRRQGADGHLARALGRDLKVKISPLLYLAAIGFAFYVPWISHAIYVFVALIWLIPDRRIEGSLDH